MSKFEEENSPFYKEEVDIQYYVSYVKALGKLKGRSKAINTVDAKLYYKLRHNLLKTYACTYLGLESVQEKPFSSFDLLGIDSERTPDLIYVSVKDAFLVEFSVSNRYANLMKTKEFYTKYDRECSISRMPIKSYYVCLALDADASEPISVLRQISADFDITPRTDVESEITDVLDTMKVMTAYLSDYVPEVLSMNVDSYVPNIPVRTIEPQPLFHESERLAGRRSYKNQRVKSLLASSLSKLSKNLRRRNLDVNYKIKINFITRNVYLFEHPEGLSKSELVDLLDTSSGRLLDHVEVTGDVYDEANVFDRYNTSNLDLDDEYRPQEQERVVDTQGYGDRLKSALHRYNMSTLTDCNLDIMQGQVSKKYMDCLAALKEEKKPIPYNKSPFIFYPTDKIFKGKFSLKTHFGNKILDTMFYKAQGMCIARDRVIDRTVDYDEILKYEKSSSKLWLDLKNKLAPKDYSKYNRMPWKKLVSEAEVNSAAKDMLEFRVNRSKLSGIVKESTRTAYENRVKINLKKDNLWDEELSHFQKTKNVYRNVVGLDFDTVKNDYRSLLTELFSSTDSMVEDSVYSETQPLGNKLAGFCDEMRKDLDSKMDQFRTTLMAHSLNLISQMCYSLLHYSNIKLNKDDFVCDNLGNENTLLIVKGGKTIRRTKVSRFFRFLFPITGTQAKLVASSSNQLVIINNQTYLLTPWRMLRFEYLKKGVELYSCYSHYYVSSMLESKLTGEDFNKFISIKTLMVFSQKRRLEVWLSTLRYIYLNALGTHTDLLTLIESMPMLDSDSLIFLLQRCFAMNYQNIRDHAKQKRLYDILWETTADNFDLIAERFDETLFVTKAPFNPHNEHMKNFKSLLDTHDYYMKHVNSLDPMVGLEKTSVEIGEDYFSRLEENDFNFDPKSAYIVGDFLGAYISASSTKADMQIKLNDIFTRSYTEVASSKGMRRSKGYFWGSKGNEVIYEDIDLDVDEILSKFPEDPSSFDKLVSQNEQTFFDKIAEMDDLCLEFDMKDKRQYKDSREIYVMSDETKILQNPLEKFFAYLCRNVPNELIQRPSNTRPKFIHYKMFEHKSDSGKKLYCTMDCRKWAPRSNLWKYYFFVKGMAKYLPKDFVAYFFKFWSLMFSKRVRFQKHFVENLATNVGYADKLKYLHRRDDGDYELIMPYSFMMGIFNHLSSLMHAGSQLYFNDVILSDTGTSANFLAHSDDSAGIITARSYTSCISIYDKYEKFQRTLNHLMSKKKCCLSERSFEMISIMYCDSRYIPMTHKFLSNVAIDVKGGGWYDDVASITGKVVDLYNSGGTFMQCYSIMLSLSELLRKAYHMPRVELLSKIPLPFGGLPNYHPIHMIMVGNSSHESLLDLTETDQLRRLRISAYIAAAGDYTIGKPETLRYRQPYVKAFETRHIVSEENKDLLSAVSSFPERGTFFGLMKHVSKTFDKKYVYSLTGFDTDQIFMSTISYKHYMLTADDKLIQMRDVVNNYIMSYMSDREFVDVDVEVPENNYTSYFQQTESMSFHYKDFSIESYKSCKPVIYNTVEMFDVRVTQNNLMYLSAIEKNDSIKKVIRNPEKFEYLKDYMMSSMPGTSEEKLKYLRLYNPQEKEEKTRSGYVFIPSSVNIDTPARFFTYSMLYTTRRYLVSSRRPQLYTPAEFNLEKKGFDDLKHFYLCIKLLETGSCNLELLESSIDGCTTCSTQSRVKRGLKKFQKMLEWRENADNRTNLSFVDYNRRQRRGKNVWYASADFTLYTSFGKVISVEDEGLIYTTWEVSSTDSLSSLWGLYRIFCSSRGIKFPVPSYEHTGFTAPKLAFNDFETPYIPPLGSKAIVVPNSRVIQRDVITPAIYRRGMKFYLNDRVLDFKIYSVNDINRLFYDTHNLKSIKEYVYRSDLSISEDLLLASFSQSKLYHLLLNDPRHYSESKDKYQRNGFLGQPGSLTRALALSDEAGETRYRSSYNHAYIKKGIVEFDSIEGVPILDMFEKVNYSRINFAEKISLEKALSGSALRLNDKENLVRLKNKMGLEALGTALVLHKHVFETMLAGSICNVPDNVLLDVMNSLFKAIHDSMATYPEAKVKHQYQGSKKSWWACIREFVEKDARKGYLADYLTQGLIRAKSDNPRVFWGAVSGNVLASSMNIHSSYTANVHSMMSGLVFKLKGRILECLLDDNGTPKYRHYALARYRVSRSQFNAQIVPPSLEPNTGEAIIIEGEEEEDALDMYIEDPNGALDEGFDCDFNERTFIDEEEEDPKDYFIFSEKDERGLAEEVAFMETPHFKIYCPIKYISYSWFGKGDFYTEIKDGINYFVSSFPGNYDVPYMGYGKPKVVMQQSLNDLEVEERDEPVQHYVPKCIKDRDSAVSVFKSLGIFDSRTIGYMFPDNRSFDEKLTSYLSSYNYIEDIVGGMRFRRTTKKVFLPGFQGVLDDRVLLAELKAMFGENCYHIISGNVKLTKSSADYMMRTLRRMFRIANKNDKSLILALTSIILDTSIESESDGWFIDKLTGYIDEMDRRLYDDLGDVILPGAPEPSSLVYNEQDMFDE
ncbi:RNA-dependent RNA polymerase [Phytophthora condilina negative stranded RNA virus 10]|nr:RNA-dependent RNA polymerase [Phytophthora condilina negative stranded RNA virus 10]